MRGVDSFTARKLLIEDQMIDDRNRALPAKDIVIERTLYGRPMDRLCLGTALNLLIVDHEDTPARRQEIEQHLRRGGMITNRHGTHRVAPSQVVTDWTPTPEKAAP